MSEPKKQSLVELALSLGLTIADENDAIYQDGWVIAMNCCQFRSTTKESFSIVNHCSNMG